MTVSNEKTRFGNSSYFSLKQIVFKTNPEIYVHFRQDPSDVSCATCQRAAMKPLNTVYQTNYRRRNYMLLATRWSHLPVP